MLWGFLNVSTNNDRYSRILLSETPKLNSLKSKGNYPNECNFNRIEGHHKTYYTIRV